MAIGYACKVIGVPYTELKGLMLKNVTEEALENAIKNNLKALEHMVEYNLAKGIGLLRISSDIIPFGSHPSNTLEWWKTFEEELKGLGIVINASELRVSMHPGQYTVLNSPDEAVVARSVQDLVYHTRFLDSLGVDRSCKIVLHVGGVYGNKAGAVKRFKENWSRLPVEVRQRLVIENDEKCYSAGDVLDIGQQLGIPVVFDNLHNSINPSGEQLDEHGWIKACKGTWKADDGKQKLHYSQQKQGSQKGAHSDTIYIHPFLEFHERIKGLGPDIMLEVKDKNISALKCINCTAYNIKRTALESEWAAYKYAVMERSYGSYRKIGGLFREMPKPDAVGFYKKLEEAMELTVEPGNAVNAAEHVWGYFKGKAEESERRRFERLLGESAADLGKLASVKRHLLKLALKYKEDYLLNSYYFMEV